MSSPYDGVAPEDRSAITKGLLDAFPLDMDEIGDVVLKCWDSIFQTQVGGLALIGRDIFPRPQIMGSFLHELIPLELARRYPETWRREETPDERDLVYVPDSAFSVEIKTSSDKNQIFGNRSYAQKSNRQKKAKSGYFLTVNFEKFPKDTLRSISPTQPAVRLVRFGWIDDEDWQGQKSASGQQARLPKTVYEQKLSTIYSASNSLP